MLDVTLRRPIAPADVDTIQRLDALAEAADGHPSLGDSVRRDLGHPTPTSAVVVASLDGKPVGALHVAPAENDADGSLTMATVVHPRHRAADLERALLDAALSDPEVGGHRIVLWVFGADDHADRFALPLGFTPERELRQMEVALPVEARPDWPEHVDVRPFRVGTDESMWLVVNNRAFADDPDQRGWSLETLAPREAEPWFDPAGFLLAWRGEALAGFCWTRLHPPSPPRQPDTRGEIYVIGVDPSHQGIGLGRALVLGGLDLLQRSGAAIGVLFVDASNVSAVGLYESLGFETVRVDPRVCARASMSLGTRYEIDRDGVAVLLAEWGEPRYRTDQVWDALYRAVTPLDDASALPKQLRTRLAGALPLALAPITVSNSGDGLTTKWLWAAGDDGAQVETVLMRSPRRASVCVSSQAGCAMDCSFCATGQAGFDRHLSSGEILEQVVRAAQSSPQRVTNVVYMGMGEPLANYDEVWSSVERLHRDLGISARRITVSTVGVVPGMRRLATEALPITLAVSLHAADDELRAQLVPLNRRYPVAEVLDAAAEVAGARGRRVTFEYACIKGVNDAPRHLDALGRLLSAWPGVGGAHVNLIPLNPTGAYGGRSPNRGHLRALALRLADHGVHVTVRRTRGTDIDAACGQLRARAIPVNPSPSTTMGR